MWLIGRGPEMEWRPAQCEAQPSASAPAVATETIRSAKDLPAPRTPPQPPSGSAQAPGSASAPAGEGQPSAKRTRVVEYTYSEGRTYTFDPDSPNPEIPCPKCLEIISILSFVCNQCGYELFKPPTEATARERKKGLGLFQQVREMNRSNRSDLGKLKQAMKSHRKFVPKD